MVPHVRLANDIAAQFAHLPREQAAAGVARHLRMFWDPRMRAKLLATVDAGGADADDLDPLAAAAAALLRTPVQASRHRGLHPVTRPAGEPARVHPSGG